MIRIPRSSMPLFLAVLFVAALAGQSAAAELPRLPTDFGKCPRQAEEFFRYLVQRRAAEGLNGIVLSEKDRRFNKPYGNRKVIVGTIYGGQTEDANVAWVAAAAYRYPWSRFHRNADLRARAFLLMDSLVGAYLADKAEPMNPLGAAVDGVYFETCQGKQPVNRPGDRPWKTEYRCVEWTPTVDYSTAPGFVSVSGLTRLCAAYWGEMPSQPGDERPANGISDWISIQHWAVWQDHLIGLGTLRCDADGGSAAGKDTARVRWRLAPVGRKMLAQERTEAALRFQIP